MKRIWLIRHGESIANAGEATQDHRNIPLSELGLKQAQALALQIPKKPDLIVTSPYLRAQQTAMCTIGRFPDTVTGIWDCVHEFVYLAPATCVGTTSQQRRPRVINYWRKLDPDYVDGEGAESYRQLIGASNGPYLCCSGGRNNSSWSLRTPSLSATCSWSMKIRAGL